MAGGIGHAIFGVSLPVWWALAGLAILGLDVGMGRIRDGWGNNVSRFLVGLACGSLLLLWNQTLTG